MKHAMDRLTASQAVKARRLDLVESKRREIEDTGAVPVIGVTRVPGGTPSDSSPESTHEAPRVSQGTAVEAIRNEAIDHFVFSEVSHDDLITRARERRRARANHAPHPPSSASSSAS